MINIDSVVTALRGKPVKSERFRPSQIDLTQPFVETEKSVGDDYDGGIVHEESPMDILHMTPKFPSESDVIAIDSTGLVLGVIPDGLVAALRYR